MPFEQDDPLPFLGETSLSLLVDVLSTARQQHTATSSQGASTDPLIIHDAETQTTERSDAAVQATTGPGPRSGAKAEQAAVASFLDAVGQGMLAELSVNTELASGNVLSVNQQKGTEEAPQCLFTLNAFSDGSISDSHARINKHHLQVTSLSWSKTGQTLAASYGRYDVQGWCSIPGAVATWNLARLGFNTASPDRFIDVDTCVICCAFHPAEPALLAGGTYNGELVIWDLNQTEANAQIAKTDVLSELRHREPITAVSWQYSSQEARRHRAGAASYRLFTLGADGRLLVWLWNQLSNPLYGYELQWTSPGNNMRVCMGGSCMAFCPAATAHEEAALLLVGTEGGRLLRCQVNDMNEASVREFAARVDAAAASSSAKLELRSAVKGTDYQLMAATVNALGACPHQRQLAVAAGGDGTLRVLDVLRSAPLLVLEPSAAGLLSAGWSPSRPLVFTAGSGDGCVYVYDLAAKQRLIRPVALLQVASSSSSSTGVNALAYNRVVPSTLAAAAGDQVQVWRLPPRLVDARPGEAKLLKRLLESEDALVLLQKQGIVA